jgi:lysophospholipase L1-like esterase
VLVADALHGQLTSAACESAGVYMMTSPQQTRAGTNPAQFDALRASDKLVLLTLGGDDLGFTSVLQECIQLSAIPLGSPCQAHFAAPGGSDQLSARVTAEGPKLAMVLAGIRQRAPRARVVLVGYPDAFPQSSGCWPAVPFTNGDVTYLRGIEVKINAMQAADARAAGDTFVDAYTATTGHDFCQPESNRDVEGLVPGSLALPFHPNARGQQAMAAAVLKALRS